MAKKSIVYGNRGALKGHLLRNKDIGGEIPKLRQDVEDSFLANGLIITEEFTNPVAAVADRFKTTSATLTTASIPTLANTLVTGAYERNITVTLAAAVGAYSTDDIEVDTIDQHGVAHTLTFTPPDADGGVTLQSNEGFGGMRVTEIRIPAQADTDGAITVGFGAGLILKAAVRSRAGTLAVIRQIQSGTGLVTNGTFLGRRYIPNGAPNATLDYAVTYEVDPADAAL